MIGQQYYGHDYVDAAANGMGAGRAVPLSGMGSGQAVPLSGVGEYFAASGMGSGQAVPLSGMGSFFMQQAPPPGEAPMEGLGLLPLISPVGAALAQDDNKNDKRDWMGGGAGYTAIGLGILAIAGFLSYQAGKAMAPSPANRPTWGWIGVPVGPPTGPIGLGVMGLVSNQQRGV